MCVGRVDGGMHGLDLSPHSQVAFMVSCELRLSVDLRHGGSERLRVSTRSVCVEAVSLKMLAQKERERWGSPQFLFFPSFLPQQQTEGRECW